VTAWGERLDAFWRVAVTHALGLAARWCLLFNGTQCRLIDALRVYARRYIEFDLELAVEDDRAFAAFWWALHATRLASDRRGPESFVELVDASDRHASTVCRALKDGVLAASTDVLRGLIRGRLPPEASLGNSLEQALTIVYRLLFLLFAEARG